MCRRILGKHNIEHYFYRGVHYICRMQHIYRTEQKRYHKRDQPAVFKEKAGCTIIKKKRRTDLRFFLIIPFSHGAVFRATTIYAGLRLRFLYSKPCKALRCHSSQNRASGKRANAADSPCTGLPGFQACRSSS